jgi:type IV pilus assembly protein PilA
MLMPLLKRMKKQKGFTLLEVLLVIGIIAVLAGIVIIALNPGKQLGDSRNAQRRSDVNTILNAVSQYALDNDGSIPSGITTTAAEICATGAASCTSLVDLSVLTTDEEYLVAMPEDPQCSTVCAVDGVGYEIAQTASGRITVSAPYAEQSETISVTR